MMSTFQPLNNPFLRGVKALTTLLKNLGQRSSEEGITQIATSAGHVAVSWRKGRSLAVFDQVPESKQLDETSLHQVVTVINSSAADKLIRFDSFPGLIIMLLPNSTTESFVHLEFGNPVQHPLTFRAVLSDASYLVWDWDPSKYAWATAAVVPPLQVVSPYSSYAVTINKAVFMGDLLLSWDVKSTLFVSKRVAKPMPAPAPAASPTAVTSPSLSNKKATAYPYTTAAQTPASAPVPTAAPDDMLTALAGGAKAAAPIRFTHTAVRSTPMEDGIADVLVTAAGVWVVGGSKSLLFLPEADVHSSNAGAGEAVSLPSGGVSGSIVALTVHTASKEVVVLTSSWDVAVLTGAGSVAKLMTISSGSGQPWMDPFLHNCMAAMQKNRSTARHHLFAHRHWLGLLHDTACALFALPSGKCVLPALVLPFRWLPADQPSFNNRIVTHHAVGGSLHIHNRSGIFFFQSGRVLQELPSSFPAHENNEYALSLLCQFYGLRRMEARYFLEWLVNAGDEGAMLDNVDKILEYYQSPALALAHHTSVPHLYFLKRVVERFLDIYRCSSTTANKGEAHRRSFQVSTPLNQTLVPLLELTVQYCGLIEDMLSEDGDVVRITTAQIDQIVQQQQQQQLLQRQLKSVDNNINVDFGSTSSNSGNQGSSSNRGSGTDSGRSHRPSMATRMAFDISSGDVAEFADISSMSRGRMEVACVRQPEKMLSALQKHLGLSRLDDHFRRKTAAMPTPHSDVFHLANEAALASNSRVARNSSNTDLVGDGMVMPVRRTSAKVRGDPPGPMGRSNSFKGSSRSIRHPYFDILCRLYDRCSPELLFHFVHVVTVTSANSIVFSQPIFVSDAMGAEGGGGLINTMYYHRALAVLGPLAADGAAAAAAAERIAARVALLCEVKRTIDALRLLLQFGRIKEALDLLSKYATQDSNHYGMFHVLLTHTLATPSLHSILPQLLPLMPSSYSLPELFHCLQILKAGSKKQQQQPPPVLGGTITVETLRPQLLKMLAGGNVVAK